MRDERDDLFEALRRAVLEGPATLSREEREAAFRGEGEHAALARKIHEAAYRVTAEEIDALRAKIGDDAVFELVVSAALGAGASRLEALRRVLP